MLKSLEKFKDEETKEDYLNFVYTLRDLWDIVDMLVEKEVSHFYSELIHHLDAVTATFKRIIIEKEQDNDN